VAKYFLEKSLVKNLLLTKAVAKLKIIKKIWNKKTIGKNTNVTEKEERHKVRDN
jgi:hypothetical protein